VSLLGGLIEEPQQRENSREYRIKTRPFSSLFTSPEESVYFFSSSGCYSRLSIAEKREGPCSPVTDVLMLNDFLSVPENLPLPFRRYFLGCGFV
jgi:hypothetical protein